MSRIVIALGGNALGNNPEEQKSLVKIPASKIASLIHEGHQVIVGHGNGPQVGMIFNSFSDAKSFNDKTPLVPFADPEQCLKDILDFIWWQQSKMNF